MSNGKIYALGAVAIVAVILIAVYAAKLSGPKITVPEEGPVVVEEKIPADPEERATFDLRKAASACRVAIMQTAKDPASVVFADEIDNTPSVVAEDGDISFNIAIKAGNGSDVVARQINCRAHREDAGWSIAELKEATP